MWLYTLLLETRNIGYILQLIESLQLQLREVYSFMDLASSRLARHAIQPIQPIQPIQLYTLYSIQHYTASLRPHHPCTKLKLARSYCGTLDIASHW